MLWTEAKELGYDWGLRLASRILLPTDNASRMATREDRSQKGWSASNQLSVKRPESAMAASSF